MIRVIKTLITSHVCDYFQQRHSEKGARATAYPVIEEGKKHGINFESIMQRQIISLK